MNGFLALDKTGCYNIIAYNEDVEEFFFYDQSITNIADAMIIMKEANIVLWEGEPPYEEWMYEPLTKDNYLD